MKRIEINVLDLFSGIGGFSKGFIDAGYKINKHYYSEIDKHAISVYKNNFKESIYAGPVELIQSGGIERPDVITFGSPCQDFSLAGRREGLGGERSSLVLEAIRIISELRPSVFIWENVKGAFSSNDGADFWAIIQAFANIGGYRLEWQLLNTVWFLPQNRERIYLVGHLAGRSEPGVFPIGEEASLRNEGEQQESNSVARTLSASVQKDNVVVGTWRTHKDDKGFREVKDGVCPTIPARAREDGSGQPVIYADPYIRRLTEIECERLQGFPDDWTKLGVYDGVEKIVPKTQRYKMLGNAVTVNVVREIAKRILLK